MSLRERAIRAKQASKIWRQATGEQRSEALLRVAEALITHSEALLTANQRDVLAGRALVEQGALTPSSAARLLLTKQKLQALSDGIRQIASVPNPVGQVLSQTELASGLELEKITSPLGVLLVIFESRPDALPQVVSLALATANAIVLKGGKEAKHSNEALYEVISHAVAPLPADAIFLVESRQEVSSLLEMSDVFDLVIPRGSNQMVRHIQQSTQIAVLGHADGVCHLYVDKEVDLNAAISVILDSKTDYPAACNAVECLLLHEQLLTDGRAQTILSALKAAGVQLFAGLGAPDVGPKAVSLHHEYSDLALTISVVTDVHHAMNYINEHGSSHTDGVLTTNPEVANTFLDQVDSACVFHNASTRFADGFRFGLGAEVGISTSKIHARGPVGLSGLLSTRYRLRGQNDVVAPFSAGKRKFTHRSHKV